MLAIAGIILIGTAFYIGVPNEVDISRMEPGLVCLVIGVALITWSLLSRFRKYVDHVPLILGLALLGIMGIYGRDVWGFAGGLAVITAWLWNRR